MKVKTLTFQQLFPTGVYANQRLGMEIEIEEHVSQEQINGHFKVMRDFIEKAFEAMNPQINWSDRLSDSAGLYHPVPGVNQFMQQETTPQDEKEQAFKDLINSKYQTKKTLENLKPQVEAMNNNEITELFNNKLKSFE